MSRPPHDPNPDEIPTGTALTVARSAPRRATATLPERVGPYLVGDLLGRGGMGVVTRGVDERSGALVALKFLDERFTADDAELHRVEREARLLSAIRHRNVALIHGIEDSGGAPVLVLELVEGETLAERIVRQPPSLEEALGIGAQVADALAAAHARGIVHRDLKPANVKIAQDGSVKVLDFGLACRAAAETPRSLASEACDADPGGVSGTLGYMSPEQITGGGASPRADTWAFGCLLYEVLTARRAFVGATPGQAVAATLGARVDLHALPAGLPEGVRDLIARCLRPDPDERPADAAEVARELRGATPGAHRIASAPAPPASSRPGLPRPRSRFIGRAAELADLRALVASERLVTLTGAGGSGKTRVALQAGIAVEDAPPAGRFADGVAFVELAVVSDPALVPDQIALALGAGDRRGRSPTQALAEALAGKDILVILDNCEHVRDALEPLVEALLAAAPRVTFVATSREPLKIAGERVVALPTLRVPLDAAKGDVARLLANESVALFVDRARSSRRGFTLDRSNADAVVRCCQRLDGIPLAIELAVARLRQVPVARLAEELEDCFRVLTGGSPAALPRHQALRATIDWSCDQLDASEAALYRRLAVFAGPFTLATAERVGAAAPIGEDDVLPLLSRLVERSLVEAVEGGRVPRWRLLEPVRQHAAERLATSGEHGDARRSFVEAIAAIARAAGDRLEGPELPDCLADLAEDHPNLLEAARVAAEEGLAARALEGLSAIGSYWVARSLWREGRSVLDGLLAAGADGEPRARATALLTTAQLSLMLGDTEEARRRSEEARLVFESSEDRASLAEALNTQAQIAWERLDLDEARRLGEASLAIRRELGLDRLATNSLNQLGIIARSARDLPAARRYLEEALAIQRRDGNAFTLAAVLCNLAVAVIDMKAFDEARPLLLEALDHARAAGSKRGEFFALTNLAHVEISCDRLGDAVRLLHRAAPLAREAGDVSGALSIVLACAQIAQRCGDPERGATLQGAALGLRDAIGASRFHNQDLFDRVAGALREQLGPDRWETLAAEGRALSMDDGLALAEGLEA